jgi:hypothetical protein
LYQQLRLLYLRLQSWMRLLLLQRLRQQLLLPSSERNRKVWWCLPTDMRACSLAFAVKHGPAR